MAKPLPTLAAFLAALPDERRAVMTALHQVIRKAVPKQAPLIMAGMGGPLIAYGKYHYKSASGSEGDWFLVGLAAGKKDYALHICAVDKGGYFVEQNAQRLGKVKTGRSCINFSKLEDLNLATVTELLKRAEKAGGINAV